MPTCFSGSKKLLPVLLLSFGFLLLSSQFQAASADTVWRNPDGHVEGDWIDEANAYDDQVFTDATIEVPDGWINSSWIEFFRNSPIVSDRIQFYTLIPDGPDCGGFGGPFSWIEFQVHKNGAWDPPVAPYHRIDCWNDGGWTEVPFDQGSVDRVRLRFSKQPSQGSQTASIAELDFGEYSCSDNAPDAPTLSSPPNGATGQPTSLTVSWNAISNWGINCAGNSNTYEVFLDTSADPSISWGTEPEGSTSKSISGLDPGTTYYWKVRASNGVLSSDSPIWSFTTEAPCPTPGTPTLSETQTGGSWSSDNTPYWTWNNPGGGSGATVDYYQYYYSWRGGGYATTTNTYYNPTVPDGSYYLQVRAHNDCGNYGSWSSAIWVYIDTQDPSITLSENHTTPDPYHTSPNWNWTASDNGPSGLRSSNRYYVERSWDTNFWSDSTSYHPTLSPGTYSVRVRAYDNAGNIGYSSWVTVTILEPTGTISGYVYEDDDASCPILSPPQLLSEVITVRVFPGSLETTTALDTGYYEFASVPYGVGYQVTAVRPSGDWSCACATGTDESCTATVTVDSGTPDPTANFSILNESAGWFQVIDGDIHVEQDIYNDVPQ